MPTPASPGLTLPWRPLGAVKYCPPVFAFVNNPALKFRVNPAAPNAASVEDQWVFERPDLKTFTMSLVQFQRQSGISDDALSELLAGWMKTDFTNPDAVNTLPGGIPRLLVSRPSINPFHSNVPMEETTMNTFALEVLKAVRNAAKAVSPETLSESNAVMRSAGAVMVSATLLKLAALGLVKAHRRDVSVTALRKRYFTYPSDHAVLDYLLETGSRPAGTVAAAPRVAAVVISERQKTILSVLKASPASLTLSTICSRMAGAYPPGTVESDLDDLSRKGFVHRWERGYYTKKNKREEIAELLRG